MYQSSTNEADPRARATRAEVARWLVGGGDERIRLTASGRNRYGCAPTPEPEATNFSSSTASTISPSAFKAAQDRLEAVLACASVRDAYQSGVADVRRRLAALCGLPDAAADKMVLAASGTDLHLIAADLARGDRSRRLVSVMADPSETGRGVGAALCSRRYGEASPYGPASAAGAPLAEAASASLVAIALRQACGAPRPAQAVDAEFEAAVGKAIAARGAVLLVMVDVSKTGLVAPSTDCAIRLKRRYGDALTVMVDACQFRISSESLAGYLAAGCLVAVTGSKFVGGPPFSGALLLPEGDIDRLQRAPISPALGDYSARADWPAGFISRSVLPEAQSFGLLLRWEAALHELEAFRRLSPQTLKSTLQEVAAVAGKELAAGPFEPLGAPTVRRFGREPWDATPSLFPFLVRGTQGLLDAGRTETLYRELVEARVLLGQPVPVGRRDGQPVSALRLAISARQLVEAAASDRALNALTQSIGGALEVVAARAAAGCGA